MFEIHDLRETMSDEDTPSVSRGLVQLVFALAIVAVTLLCLGVFSAVVIMAGR